MDEPEADRFGAFVRANTEILSPPLLPDMRLHLASEILPMWRMTEAALEASGLPPPYWAFAWAGGQALARYLLDRPETVRGRDVVDFGAGSGLVGIAAALAGAARVRAVDPDAYARAAIALNAQLNGTAVEVLDALPAPRHQPELILAGDVFYERELAEFAIGTFDRALARGAEILVGDPGRAYLPKERLHLLGEFRVERTRELEDADVRLTCVWRFEPEA